MLLVVGIAAIAATSLRLSMVMLSSVPVLWYGGKLMQAGEMSHGDLTQFMFYTMFIGGAVSSVPEIISNVQKTLGATQRVRELLREDGEDVEGGRMKDEGRSKVFG